ncbi:PREDICTED: probable disease resistance protein At5g45510 [Tarenaya hassleriana]|uniref:probable disease resistance protein At5g45510 n=1 Tax=Tarenaya hassleriana TaxID=28532 RepID=UPI0008FCF9CB|nr:PREDICTED: probable disease resistance protein At5g45510 [Tarenaya hassleriana]
MDSRVSSPSLKEKIKGKNRGEMSDQIAKSFQDKAVSRVVLVGESGSGKTWLSEKICNNLLSKEKENGGGSCFLALWLHLNRQLDDSSLYRNLASQLSVFFSYEEIDDDAEEGNVNDLKKKILEELNKRKNPAEDAKNLGEDAMKPKKEAKKPEKEEKKSAEDVKKPEKEEKNPAEDAKKPEKEAKKLVEDAKSDKEEKKPAEEEKSPADEEKKSATSAEEKYILLVLDDEGSITKEEEVMKDLKLQEFLEHDGGHAVKILITRREGGGGGNNVLEVEPLKKDESDALLDGSREILGSLTDKGWRVSLNSLQEQKEIDDPTLISCIIRKSKGLPAAISTLAKSLSRLKRNGSNETVLSEEQKKAFEESILSSESSESAAGCKSAIDPKKYNPVLYLAYELMKHDKSLHTAVVACFWHSLDFFQHCGCVYYRELIANWILEGYFDPVWSVEEAYREGHTVLMELMDRGFLKIQDGNVVVPEMAMSNLIDLRDCGVLGRSRLGFARVYGGEKGRGVGKITHPGDMMRTVRSKKVKSSATKLETKIEVSTILVSGNRLCQETCGKFFEGPEREGLQVLGLFDPRFESLVSSLSKLKKLRVLVIKDCDLLKEIDKLGELNGLHVLEVSGASSLTDIQDDFFRNMTQLRSLNLSGLMIRSSPSSISQLSELKCLVMRNCPELEDLPDVQSLTNLEVIDIHGARKLKTCFDKTVGKDKNKGKNKNFAHLEKLQHLDLSGSQIDRLPIFQDSKQSKRTRSLTRLLLRDCNKLRRLPHLKPLSALQILDISGCKTVNEMYEVCFEDKDELRTLNLSGTSLRELPNEIAGLSKLSQFLLRDCKMLGSLPNIEALANLEVFDVSGCEKLEKIDGSFKGMSYLRELNLCGTKLKTLPELPRKKKSCLRSSKRIVLPDSREWKLDEWSKIEEELRSSGAIDETREILGNKSETGEKTEDEAQAGVRHEKKGEGEEFVHDGDRYDSVYMKIRNFMDSDSGIKILEIRGSNDWNCLSDHEKETLAKAEFVSFAENRSESVSSIFEAFKMRSVKGCWVEKCVGMETLFAGIVESLEILWISNLPLMKSICSEGSFVNLKKLSIDCCPNIKTLFPVPHLPKKLENLRIRFCDNLEEVFGQEGGARNSLDSVRALYLFGLPELTTVGAKLQNLETFTKEKCSKLCDTKETLKYKETL